MAYIVENDVVLDALVREVGNCRKNQVDILYDSKITNYVLHPTGAEPAQVTLADGSQLSAELIVSLFHSLFYRNCALGIGIQASSVCLSSLCISVLRHISLVTPDGLYIGDDW